ncbi:aidB regulatorAbrB [Salmonella enterica subsp. enterica serovar Enteritidis str. CDC_2010K_1795]|nr:aidB regulatorAbrB [Salmonella enterica subsp. enterica serovar Enteritidis str. CDC_2010K_1795]ELN71554.1 aidB regulatorAbrB [Salmonella enterica subsp. enterica serovar Enteritidis str. 638970-15]
MPILQWFLLFLLSLLISLIFLWLHLPAAMLLGPMIAGIVLSLRGSTLQLPRGIFLAAQAILGCMIAQNLTGSILTTLALYWPVVLLVLLVTLLSSAIVGWLLVRYSSLPGNTGAWGVFAGRRGGNGSDGARLRGGYPPGGVYAVSTGTVCGWRGGAGDTPDTRRQRGSGQPTGDLVSTA